MKFNVNGREVEGYYLTPNEMIELYEDKSLSEEVHNEVEKLIISNFKYYLCGESNEQVLALFISSYLNGKVHNYTEVAKWMGKDHPELQKYMFNLFLSYVKVLAKRYEEKRIDGRNEDACRIAYAFKQLLENGGV